MKNRNKGKANPEFYSSNKSWSFNIYELIAKKPQPSDWDAFLTNTLQKKVTYLYCLDLLCTNIFLVMTQRTSISTSKYILILFYR